MKMCKLSLAVSGLLVCYSNAVANLITVDFTGVVYTVGSALLGDGVAVDDTVIGQFVYNTDSTNLGDEFFGLYSGEGFDISIGGVFGASSPDGTLRTQNDQQNGSATLPADGLTFPGGPGSSDGLNGRSATGWQFGLRRENILGDLWADSDPPDLSDWAGVTLADINAPDWHWIQFETDPGDNSIFDSQIRWDITSFEVSSEAPVPEPATLGLMGMGLVGLAARARKKRRQV